MHTARWFMMAFAATTTTVMSREADAEGSRVITLAQFERAAEEQPQRLFARAAVHFAEGQADETGALLWPQVTAIAQYTRATGNFAPTPIQRDPATGGGTSLTASWNYWQFGIGATELLYDFGQTIHRVEAAGKTVDAQRLAERTTELAVVLAVRRAYFAARATRELAVVAQQAVDDQNRHLTQVQGFVLAGTQPQIALAQQRAAVANAEVSVVEARNNYETAKAQLNQAAGLTQGTEYDVGDEALAPLPDEEQPLEMLAAKALAARPEMATLDEQRQAQEHTIAAARGGYGPTLSASAGASEAGIDFGGLVPNWYGGMTLSWPIFQGGLTRAQVRAAEAGLESLNAQKSTETLQVRFDVDAARLTVGAAKGTIASAEEAALSAREQLTLAEQRYASGIGNIIELNDAQLTYSSAAAQVVQARYGLASARAQLLAALGRR